MKAMQKTVITALSVLLLVTGATAQSQSDLPEPGMTPASPFYFLEQASESMALAVAKAPVIGSPELESKVRANQASERLAEARRLAEQNRTELVGNLMEQYTRQMNRSVAIAENSRDENLRKRLGTAAANQTEVLEKVEKKVPGEAKAGVRNAIERNRESERRLGRPSIPGKSGNSDVRDDSSETGRNRTPTAPELRGPGNRTVEESGNLPENRTEEVTENASENLTGNEKTERNSSVDVDVTGGSVVDAPGREKEGNGTDENLDNPPKDVEENTGSGLY